MHCCFSTVMHLDGINCSTCGRFFIFGVAVGLYEYYMFNYSRQRRIQVAAFVLAGITAACFGFMLLWSWGIYLVALVLIAAGAWIVFGRRLKWAKW